MTQPQQPRPICTQCGKRPVVRDGKTKKGKVRYRTRCGSCVWKNRMEGVRDERTALYKAAQQSEVKMLAERRLRVKLGESLQGWIKEADGRQRIIAEQDAQVLTLKERNRKLAEGRNEAVAIRWALEKERDALEKELVDLKRKAEELVADRDEQMQLRWQWQGKCEKLHKRRESDLTKLHLQADTLSDQAKEIKGRAELVEGLKEEKRLLKKVNVVLTADCRSKRALIQTLNGEVGALKVSVAQKAASLHSLEELHVVLCAKNDRLYQSRKRSDIKYKQHITVMLVAYLVGLCCTFVAIVFA